MAMRKGTTPTFTFTIPFGTELVKTAKVIFEGDNGVKLEKRTENCGLAENKITVRLTQEETFLFDCNEYIKVQLRIITTAGESLTSDPVRVFVAECLDDEVLE
jgi:hypothetical protein